MASAEIGETTLCKNFKFLVQNVEFFPVGSLKKIAFKSIIFFLIQIKLIHNLTFDFQRLSYD